MKKEEIPMERRVRMLINDLAHEMSITNKCDVCGSKEGADIFEEPDEEMLSMMPEHSAIGTCRHCGAVVMYTFPELFTFEGESDDDIMPVEYRVLSA